MTTEEVIAGMLTENTGRALCDSGGYPSYDADGNYTGSSQGYGRNHERNRGRDFASEPPALLSFSLHGDGSGGWWMDLTLNVYHWLVDRLEYAEELDKSFHAFANLPEHKEDSWFKNYADWLSHLNDNGHILASEDEFGGGCNTYNHECLLSQTLQFNVFEIESSEEYEFGRYVWLQVHGGADVRGGYTAPRLFKLDDWNESAIWDFARATIRPNADMTEAGPDKNQQALPGMENIKPDWDHDNVYWDTYDGYHWETETGLDLKEVLASDDPEDRGKGKIYVDEDGNGYCPLTGGKLEAFGW